MTTAGSDREGPRRRVVAAAVTATGAGVTVFGLVAVAVIEALNVAFSAIVGLPVGVVAGTMTAAVLFVRVDDLDRGSRAVADGVAGVGHAAAGIVAARYVDLAGARTLSVRTGLAVAVAVGVVAGVASWLGRGDRP